MSIGDARRRGTIIFMHGLTHSAFPLLKASQYFVNPPIEMSQYRHEARGITEEYMA
jgi:hypothetical protein